MSASLFDQAGIKITQQGTVKDIFKQTGLDWLVEQEELHTNHSQRYPKHIVANYRSDNHEFLGVVNKKEYKVVQNVEAFDFIDQLTNFTFEKVGMFNNGKKVFVVGKSNEQIEIDSGDKIDFYLTFLHGHDGKSAIRFFLSPIRLFCMNQMTVMLEKATFKYNITHTGDINTKLGLIQKAINNSKNYVNNLQQEIENMINSKPSITIETFVSTLIEDNDDDTKLIATRKQESRDKIIDLYQNKDDLQNYKSTVFGMVSAVSDYISHKAPLRNSQNKDTINNMFINNINGNDLIEKARTILRRF